MKSLITPVAVTPRYADTLEIAGGAPADSSGRLTYHYQLSSSQEPNTVLKMGRSEMTPAQWSAWPTGGTITTDEAYQLACIAENIGFAIAS